MRACAHPWCACTRTWRNERERASERARGREGGWEREGALLGTSRPGQTPRVVPKASTTRQRPRALPLGFSALARSKLALQNLSKGQGLAPHHSIMMTCQCWIGILRRLMRNFEERDRARAHGAKPTEGAMDGGSDGSRERALIGTIRGSN